MALALKSSMNFDIVAMPETVASNVSVSWNLFPLINLHSLCLYPLLSSKNPILAILTRHSGSHRVIDQDWIQGNFD